MEWNAKNTSRLTRWTSTIGLWKKLKSVSKSNWAIYMHSRARRRPWSASSMTSKATKCFWPGSRTARIGLCPAQETTADQLQKRILMITAWSMARMGPGKPLNRNTYRHLRNQTPLRCSKLSWPSFKLRVVIKKVQRSRLSRDLISIGWLIWVSKAW